MCKNGRICLFVANSHSNGEGIGNGPLIDAMAHQMEQPDGTY